MHYNVYLCPTGVLPRDATSLKEIQLDISEDSSNLLKDAKNEIVQNGIIDRNILSRHWKVYSIETPLEAKIKDEISINLKLSKSGFPILMDGQQFAINIKSSGMENEIIDWYLHTFFENGVTQVSGVIPTECAFHSMHKNKKDELEGLLQSLKSGGDETDVINTLTKSQKAYKEYGRINPVVQNTLNLKSN